MIEFIPLIELATKKHDGSKKAPSGSSLTNSSEWDLYQEMEIKKNYLNIPKPIRSGIYQYRLFDIGLDDLERAIKLHVEDINIHESCSLFGGYAISICDKIELFPQCCGLLEEIQQWKKILDENFEEFYLFEGHPSPLITKKQEKIIIICGNEDEPFYPYPTKDKIELNYEMTKIAFLTMLEELKLFSEKLNYLSSKFHVKNISNILIWGTP